MIDPGVISSGLSSVSTGDRPYESRCFSKLRTFAKVAPDRLNNLRIELT
jgi:hypothetical protein